MAAWEQAQHLWNNLLALGARRLAVLGVMGLSVFAVMVLAGYYLSRPTTEVLYSGLDRQDVAGIGSALKEAGIPFDVSADGASVVVPVGQTAMARMTLAEKGLPHSNSVGNELFDKLGSLGLTSFMQEVTRVRAMEGELARTIQMMRGVKAARVHIVMADEGPFRRARQPPSASVVIRTESADDRSTAQAIRHLVSAALPGMTVDEVTVLNVEPGATWASRASSRPLPVLFAIARMLPVDGWITTIELSGARCTACSAASCTAATIVVFTAPVLSGWEIWSTFAVTLPAAFWIWTSWPGMLFGETGASFSNEEMMFFRLGAFELVSGTPLVSVTVVEVAGMLPRDRLSPAFRLLKSRVGDHWTNHWLLLVSLW